MFKTLAEVEKEHIIGAIKRSDNIIKAAELLGIGKTTVYRKLLRYKIRPEFILQEAQNNHIET